MKYHTLPFTEVRMIKSGVACARAHTCSAVLFQSPFLVRARYCWTIRHLTKKAVDRCFIFNRDHSHYYTMCAGMPLCGLYSYAHESADQSYVYCIIRRAHVRSHVQILPRIWLIADLTRARYKTAQYKTRVFHYACISRQSWTIITRS